MFRGATEYFPLAVSHGFLFNDALFPVGSLIEGQIDVFGECQWRLRHDDWDDRAQLTHIPQFTRIYVDKVKINQEHL